MSNAASHRLLKLSAASWLAVAAAGQLAFIGFIVAFYWTRTLSGDWAAWNDKPLIRGHVAGDAAGNSVFAAHVLLAAVMTLAGLLQLVPALRRALPRLHRWSGRVFLSLAGALALSGVWLTLGRGTYLSVVSGAAILVDAVLILVFGALAWRRALQRRFDAHRQWAMRAFMAASGVWFLRVGLMGWIILNKGPRGMTDSMSGPADVAFAFGSYLAPLALLELYFLASRGGPAAGRLAVAGGLGAATLFTVVGVAGTIFLMWGPNLV